MRALSLSPRGQIPASNLFRDTLRVTNICLEKQRHAPAVPECSQSWDAEAELRDAGERSGCRQLDVAIHIRKWVGTRKENKLVRERM